MQLKTINILIALGLFSLSQTVLADIRPVFNPEAASWHAAEIIVVHLVDDEKGLFQVSENWKGTIKPKSMIELSVLRHIKNSLKETGDQTNRSINNTDLPDSAMKQPIVLFLRGTATSGWLPAALPIEMNQEDINTTLIRSYYKLSMVWLLNDVVFAFKQDMSPGPLTFGSLYNIQHLRESNDYLHIPLFTKENLKQLVITNNHIQGTLHEIKKQEDCIKLKDSIIEYIIYAQKYSNYVVQDEVLKVLSLCGDSAYGVIKMLINDSFKIAPSTILWRFAQMGGANTEKVLMLIVDDEFNFWKSVVINPSRYNIIQLAYKSEIMFYGLYGLAALPYPGCATCYELTEKIKSFWQQHPQLGKSDHIIETCNYILEKKR